MSMRFCRAGLCVAVLWFLYGESVGRSQEPGITEQAVALMNRGAVVEATTLVRDHLKKQPNDVQARLLLGRILEYTGQPDGAIEVWQQGARNDDTGYPLWIAIGAVRARQGEEGPLMEHRGDMVVLRAQKAALALGGLKIDESQRALETGLLNPDVSIYCQAALYRQTGEPKYLVQIAKVLRKDEWPASILADYLGKMKVPAVQALVNRYRERESGGR